jgi:hypothetical protein
MPEKKQDNFTVTDRRLFTSEGELRKDAPEETAAAPVETPKSSPGNDPAPEMPPVPTASEQKTQADAYHKSSKELDSQASLRGYSAKDLEMTFQRFLASLYMTAMLQLGLMREEGAAEMRIDLLGARQTVDTLGLLAEKTKGNLTAEEENFLQSCLYELRMAYVEVTNALARPPQPNDKGTGTTGR